MNWQEKYEELVQSITKLADQFAQFAESDRREAKSKKDDDPDKHYWEGCADANSGRADDLAALLGSGTPDTHPHSEGGQG